MKSSRNFYLLLAMVLFGGLSVSAQTAPADNKEFNKDGLTFSYPAGWAFNDNSNKDAQQMTFGRPDSEAQITVFVFRVPVVTPEKIAEAKRVLVDKYIANPMKSFEQVEGHPQSSP